MIDINKKPFHVAGDLKLISVSQRQMAALLGISTTRVNQLIDEGVMVRDESRSDGRLMLAESLANFYLSKDSQTTDSANFWKERALHERAKRQLAELKVAERRGELYEAVDVETFITELILNARNKLLVLPTKLATQLVGLNAAQICAIIGSEIEDVLKELAEGADLNDRAGSADEVGSARREV